MSEQPLLEGLPTDPSQEWLMLRLTAAVAAYKYRCAAGNEAEQEAAYDELCAAYDAALAVRAKLKGANHG